MNIGRLDKQDLRTLWKREATEFTPWLAQEENIKLLSDAIGIDLEVQSQEESIGAFRADILCKDTFSGYYVLIENQLERTDHTHLGQLITYAAGLEAVTIIWIAQNFTDEHRAALDWLNSITDDTFTFFGIEIKIYKIGDSFPAPMFNIVSKPNDWSKQVKRTVAGTTATETKLLQQEYWQGLKEFMENNKSFVKMRNPSPQSYSDLSIGKSSIYLSATVNSKHKSINIWLNIMGENAKKNYDKLYQTSYENSLIDINKDLVWDRMEGRKMSSVILKREADYTDKSDWVNQFDWFKENLERFVKYFKPLITNI
jgi:hypothetical protein